MINKRFLRDVGIAGCEDLLLRPEDANSDIDNNVLNANEFTELQMMVQLTQIVVILLLKLQMKTKVLVVFDKCLPLDLHGQFFSKLLVMSSGILAALAAIYQYKSPDAMKSLRSGYDLRKTRDILYCIRSAATNAFAREYVATLPETNNSCKTKTPQTSCFRA